MGRYAGVSRKEIRIDGDGLDEELLRRIKLTPVSGEFAEKGERFDILRIDGESGPAACLGLDRAPLLAQRQGKTQIGRGVVGLHVQRVTVALHRRFHTTHLEEHGAQVPMVLGARRVERERPLKHGDGLVASSDIAQHMT